MADEKVEPETNPRVLLLAMVRKLPVHIWANGQVVLPALPSFIDLYTESLSTIFASLGRVFSPSEVEHLRGELKRELDAAFAESPYSKIIVDYKTDPQPSTVLRYTVTRRVVTLGDEYAGWVKTRKPPLFGAHADAKRATRIADARPTSRNERMAARPAANGSKVVKLTSGVTDLL